MSWRRAALESMDYRLKCSTPRERDVGWTLFVSTTRFRGQGRSAVCGSCRVVSGWATVLARCGTDRDGANPLAGASGRHPGRTAAWCASRQNSGSSVPTSDQASCPARAALSIRECAAPESPDVLRCGSRRQSCGARSAGAFERSSTLLDELDRLRDVSRELGNPGFRRVFVRSGSRSQAGRFEQPGAVQLQPALTMHVRPFAARFARRDLDCKAILV
jgi:hypothetical protein